jgi:hypothetical protein
LLQKFDREEVFSETIMRIANEKVIGCSS